MMDENQATIVLNKDTSDGFIDFSSPYDLSVVIKVLDNLMKSD